MSKIKMSNQDVISFRINSSNGMLEGEITLVPRIAYPHLSIKLNTGEEVRVELLAGIPRVLIWDNGDPDKEARVININE